MREYTFLLDPAELRATQSAQVAPAPAAARPARGTPAAAPAAETPRPQRSARADETAGEPAARAATPSRYRVKAGDTLSRIAGRLKPVDVSLDMMLVALYRANPDAFIGNNMNRLKSGQILSIPSADSLGAVDAGDAHGTVVAHAADFNAYRAKLAGQVATSAPAREAAPGQSATGRITAKVEERPTAANESQDQLRLSKATPSRPGASTAANAEDVVAREKELADAQTRVKELEKNVNALESLITVKSQTGATANQRAADAPAAPVSTPIVPAAPTVVAQADTGPQPAPKIKVAPKPVTPEAPAETSLADTLMDNILYLGAGAAVLLLAALGLSQRRKQKVAVQASPNPPTILGSAAQPAQAMFAETGGQSVDTHDSVFNSSFAPSASQLDTNEVDPLAEAELYLAYNFDTQAEDILKEALRNDPYRHPVRLKLLEIYAARKDVRAFETQATELYSLTGGKGDEWAQAAALGHTLDPANPMYAQAAGMGGGAALAAGAAGAAGVAAGAGLAAVTADHDGGPQTMLSQQLEQAFRGRGEALDVIEPASTVDAVTGASLDKGFDLDSLGLDQDATALPQALQTDAQTDAKADDNLLDFDLGGLSFEPVAANGAGTANAVHDDPTAVPDLQFEMEPFAPLEPASGTPVVADNASLDDLAFDMNFDAPAAGTAAPVADEDDAFVLDLSKNGPNTDIDMAQLAREFELPPLPEAPGTPPASDLKDPLFDLDAMDFGLSDTTPVTPVGVRQEPVFDFGSTDLDLTTPGAAPAPDAQDLAATPAAGKDPLFDLDMMDFGQPATPAAPQDDPFALDEVPAIPNPGTPIPRFDLSNMDLDLPASDFALAEPQAAPADQAGATAELTPAQMEMETKLDLAIAYQEIGDKEGARELLDEVIKGGNVEQSSRASAMRAQLA
ncbi:MAG: pilus assembly protein FimV [Candidatus Accumulibacter sp.]|nr:pilus assembly protein FimV [Accumulibacter sp.]